MKRFRLEVNIKKISKYLISNRRLSVHQQNQRPIVEIQRYMEGGREIGREMAGAEKGEK
jgi:hypothetical protein